MSNREDFEGCITEIGANKTLAARDDYNKGWNAASDSCIRLIRRYIEGKGLFQQQVREVIIMKIFKCEAQDDTVYIQAVDQAAAAKRLYAVMGSIPANLLTWSEVDALPEGEEFL